MSDLEEAFLRWWAMLQDDAPPPVREYRFDPHRRFRADFAWPEARVLVEIEGGTWAQGRHTRPAGYAADCEKYNRAQELGFRLFRYTGEMLKADPAGVVEQVASAVLKLKRR